MFPQGYTLEKLPLDPLVKNLVLEENWKAVEDVFLRATARDGEIYSFLQKFHPFHRIEIMISIRDAANEWEEDGIWHDDGSRVFAFSLSLTLDLGSLRGGNLELRKIGSEESSLIPTPEFGTAILFLTGIHGFEHRTRKVEKGRRIILVGWCT